ncbi:hypothetical protein IWQ62_005621 [Dispira parvispora]|uniref:Uncharacterized protein n=1 Tax=Dispira parvispora TaxID=1520584 RepID=A0A9W8AID6_9FUNG|nr:hypothetical protein IWQ62_005621 [Dispira parvispora]
MPTALPDDLLTNATPMVVGGSRLPPVSVPTGSPINAVFITEFHVHHGNCLRFQYPAAIDLPQIEFLSMPSGLHQVTDDVIYFSLGKYYGMSCYGTIRVFGKEASALRGAKMLAIGAVAKRVEDLRLWIPYFKRLLAYTSESAIRRQLESLFKAQPSSASTSLSHYTHRVPLSTRAIHTIHELSADYHLNQLAADCGSGLYIIWKNILLQRRILISTQPPVHVACQYGSTDRIIETKDHLYDLLIQVEHVNGRIVVQIDSKADTKNPVLQINHFDRRRFKRDLERHFNATADYGESWLSGSFESGRSHPESRASLHLGDRFLSTSFGRTSSDQFRRISRKMGSHPDQKRISVSSTTSMCYERTLLTCSGKQFSLLEYLESITTKLLIKLEVMLQRLFDKSSSTSPRMLILKAKNLLALGLHPFYDAEFVEQLAQIYFPNYPPVRVKKVMLSGYSFLLWDTVKGSLNSSMCACNHACLRCQTKTEPLVPLTVDTGEDLLADEYLQ